MVTASCEWVNHTWILQDSWKENPVPKPSLFRGSALVFQMYSRWIRTSKHVFCGRTVACDSIRSWSHIIMHQKMPLKKGWILCHCHQPFPFNPEQKTRKENYPRSFCSTKKNIHQTKRILYMYFFPSFKQTNRSKEWVFQGTYIHG